MISPSADLPPPWIDLLVSGGTSRRSPRCCVLPAAVRTTDNLVTDGREEFMRNVVHHTYLRLYRHTTVRLTRYC